MYIITFEDELHRQSTSDHVFEEFKDAKQFLLDKGFREKNRLFVRENYNWSLYLKGYISPVQVFCSKGAGTKEEEFLPERVAENEPLRIMVTEDLSVAEESIQKGSKFPVKESWAVYNKPTYEVLYGPFTGYPLPRESCQVVTWETYSNEEKKTELEERLTRYKKMNKEIHHIQTSNTEQILLCLTELKKL